MSRSSNKSSANTRFCTQCGAANPSDGRFCMKCGRSLVGGPIAPTSPMQRHTAIQPASFIDRLWVWLRQQHIAVQIAVWIFLWWIIIPVLIWRTSWRTGIKVALTTPFALMIITAIARDPNTSPQVTQRAGVASSNANTTGRVVATEASTKPRVVTSAGSGASSTNAAALLASPVASTAPVPTAPPTAEPTTIPTVQPTVIPTVGPTVAQASQTANMRNYPSTDSSDVIGKVQAGDVVTLESKTLDSEWYEVTTESGARGYISASLLTVAPDVIARVPTEDAGPPPVKPTSMPAQQAGKECDPNYSGACIPLVNYDLDCGDVADKNFRVVGADPHGFDRENDGLACES